MTVAAFKIKVTVRPVSEEQIGFRMVLAHPNKAQWNQRMGCYQQSFHPKYRISESGDYTEMPTPNQVEHWLDQQMEWFKITGISVH